MDQVGSYFFFMSLSISYMSIEVTFWKFTNLRSRKSGKKPIQGTVRIVEGFNIPFNLPC